MTRSQTDIRLEQEDRFCELRPYRVLARPRVSSPIHPRLVQVPPVVKAPSHRPGTLEVGLEGKEGPRTPGR